MTTGEDEYRERQAAAFRRMAENTHIAEWLRANAPKFVAKFLTETYPQPTERQGDEPQ